MWIQGGFIVSFVLNVFALGFILSGPFLHYGPPDPSRRLYEAAERLTPESRERVMTILDKHTEEIEAAMQGMPEDFKDLSRILASPALSDKDIEKAFRNIERHHAKVSILLTGMFTELAQALPDQNERITFFKGAIPPEPPFPPRRKKSSPHRDR